MSFHVSFANLCVSKAFISSTIHSWSFIMDVMQQLRANRLSLRCTPLSQDLTHVGDDNIMSCRSLATSTAHHCEATFTAHRLNWTELQFAVFTGVAELATSSVNRPIAILAFRLLMPSTHLPWNKVNAASGRGIRQFSMRQHVSQARGYAATCSASLCMT